MKQKKMVKEIMLQLLFAFLFLQANAISIEEVKEASQSCMYTVVITTSCSSTSYTRDLISLSFGDAYGNQVYVPRLEDPSTRTFERCSADTFRLHGPCTRDVCYVYVYRRGYDGWMPATVQIYGQYTRAVTFTYNVFIPSDVWWGYNYCSRRLTA